MTFEDRFFEKVSPEPNSGCHLWTAHCNREGYGTFKLEGKKARAHRVAWEIANGPIPDGLHVCHTCDVPECVNPSHLWVGTNTDNMRDCVKKGRHHNSKKTHCPMGHALVGKNLYIYPKSGKRQCSECFRIRHRKNYQIKKKSA